MANTKSAEKAARQSTVHRARNDALTSQLRSAIRKATLALKAGNQGRQQLPQGIYSNVLSAQKIPVPPTVLLMDGLNSGTTALMQVHQQTARMLTSLPEDVPVAVFLMDRNLHLLQSFTTDPNTLEVIGPASFVSRVRSVQTDPIDLGSLHNGEEVSTHPYIEVPEVRFSNFQRIHVKAILKN